MSDYTPKPENKFTFGLWTVGNIGRDPFGGPVREQKSPADLVRLLGEVGAWGVNFHDNDLIPIDATPSERDAILKEFKKALADTGIVVPMATTNLFSEAIFKDGAFTSNDSKVRAYALQKTMNAIDLGVEFGAKTYVFWGGREGTETDATKNPIDAIKRSREAMNFLCEYALDQKYDLKFALEAKPNEPRGDIYNSTTGHMLAFINTLDHPEMVGVNPEVAHESMAGLNFVHGVAQALESGKLFHIDLNDQAFGRYDQDFRFGAVNLKSAFFLVKLLEDNISKVPYLELVTSCRNAFDAMKVLQENKIDLIFIDIQMPGLTGLQFIASLETKPLVIFITAYKEFALEGYDLAVADYLVKPVPLERFRPGYPPIKKSRILENT